MAAAPLPFDFLSRLLYLLSLSLAMVLGLLFMTGHASRLRCVCSGTLRAAQMHNSTCHIMAMPGACAAAALHQRWLCKAALCEGQRPVAPC